MTALTAATAMANIDIAPENLFRMMDLPLPCSMLPFAMNTRKLWMVTVFGIGNIAERAPTVRAHVGRPAIEEPDCRHRRRLRPRRRRQSRRAEPTMNSRRRIRYASEPLYE